MKKCTYTPCSCSNPDDANYCRKCGCNFQSIPINEIAPPTHTPYQITNSKNLEIKTESDDTWRVIATIILIIVAIAIAVGTVGIGTPFALGIAYIIKGIWKKN